MQFIRVINSIRPRKQQEPYNIRDNLKKQYLILITAGILVALAFYKANKIFNPDIISPGDKSNEVGGLQNALSALTGVKFSNVGAYDTDTRNAVQYYMEGSNALIDYEKGSVDKNFAADLYLIQSKVK